MKDTPNRTCTRRYTPQQEAWVTAFFIENHLDHFVYPQDVASPEQVRFMVFTEDEERYYPCSDQMFAAIRNRSRQFMKRHYDAVFQRITALIDREIEDKREKAYLRSLIEIKFRHETRDGIMLPSRLEKRLIRIFLERTKIEDPWLAEKKARNQRVSRVLESEALRKALDRLGGSDLGSPFKSLNGIRKYVEQLELKRLIRLSAHRDLWETDRAEGYTDSDYLRIFDRSMEGDGVEPLFEFIGIGERIPTPAEDSPKRILWLVDESGEIIVDLAMIRCLIKLGHKVIIAFKQGPVCTKTSICDVQKDPILGRALGSTFFIDDNRMSKNELIRILRSGYDIIALSDGTRESLNLLLASTTFARLFKEVDGIISRGVEQRRRFFENHFRFTQNIYNISAGEGNSVQVRFKPKHPAAIKFSHRDLELKATSIIDRMKEAKAGGMTVIFYSAIIGSIPGRIAKAKEIIRVFVNHLKGQFADTFIINPSEHFEPGMDADDLMYMWEIVQRSGFIDIWRFQTYEDIVQAFHIMGKKVPPEWVGKDATFSTGCTKEMNIAIDVLRSHPEMQIIGPAKEKFMRRNEYGIGKMYDKRLGDPVLRV